MQFLRPSICATFAVAIYLIAPPSHGQQNIPLAVWSLFVAGENLKSYCEKSHPGTGEAIAQAMALIRREQPEFVRHMEGQQFYQDALKSFSVAVAKDPEDSINDLKIDLGQDTSCQTLAQKINLVGGLLAADIKVRSEDYKSIYKATPGK